MINNTKFYDKVLNDFNRYSYFVAVDIKSTTFNGPVIIENDDLFFYLNQTEGVDKNQFKVKVKEKLVNHSAIDIGNSDLTKWDFIKITEIQSINNISAKGADEFIKTYFDGDVLKDGVTDNERAAIIYQLFKWEISSKLDDETGYLVIHK